MKYYKNTTPNDPKGWDYKAPTILVKLPYVEGTWSINYGKGHVLSGYGEDWRGHVVYEGSQGRAVTVVDHSALPSENVSKLISGPMVDPARIHSEPDPTLLSYVNLKDYVKMARELGSTVTELSPKQAAATRCPRCQHCDGPVYKWGGLLRHYGVSGVRTDNTVATACP